MEGTSLDTSTPNDPIGTIGETTTQAAGTLALDRVTHA